MNQALIIGGSLGGLFTSLLLRQAGWDVTVFERSAGDLASRGAGVGTHPEQLDVMRRLGVDVDASLGVTITSRICLGRDGAVIANLPFEKVMSSWGQLYRALRRLLPDADYRSGMLLQAVEQHDDGVTAIFADGSRIDGDLLIGADGLRSTVRSCCFDAGDPCYAGYVAWRGVLSADNVPPLVRDTILDHFAFYLPPHEMVLSYPVPTHMDEADPPRFGLNWMWYHPAHETKILPAMCTDASGRYYKAGIPPPLIRPEVIAKFQTDVQALLPPPYAAAMAATPDPFFQPIFDLEPSSIVAGRVALLGDAACVARPHVAAGVTKAALNAAWLTDALIASATDIDSALATYAARAQPFGSAMVARARWIGAYLEDPPRAGINADPLSLMQAIGAKLETIPGLIV